jgi:hypothetical protein
MIDLSAAPAAWVLGVHLLSAHAPDTYMHHGAARAYRAETPGAYIWHRPSCLSAGAYRNSLARWSAHIGCTVQPLGRLGVSVSAVTGYGAPRLAVLPRLHAGPWRLTLGASRGTAFLHLSAEWPTHSQRTDP